MPSDIILDGEIVKVEAWDLQLDHPDRRKANTDSTVPRRALVHGFDDELVINYDGDYPGGVKIHGPQGKSNINLGNTLVSIGTRGSPEPTHIVVGNWLGTRSIRCIAETLELTNSALDEQRSNIALAHTDGDKLVINKGGGYVGGVTIEGDVVIPETVNANNAKVKALNAGAINTDDVKSKTLKVQEKQVSGDPRETTVTETFTLKITPTTILKTEHKLVENRRTGHQSESSSELDLVTEVTRLSEDVRINAEGELVLNPDRKHRGVKVEGGMEISNSLQIGGITIQKEAGIGSLKSPNHVTVRDALGLSYVTIEPSTLKVIRRRSIGNPEVLDLVAAIENLQKRVKELEEKLGLPTPP